MAKNNVKFDIDDKAVKAKLAEIEAGAKAPKPLLETIGSGIKGRIRMGFRKGVDPYGAKWKPLRSREGQPLRDSGRLQSSIVSQANSQYVDIGTNVIYGPVHQFGAEIHAKNAPYLVFKMGGKKIKTKRVTVPARPFLPIIIGTVQLPTPWKNSALNAVKNHLGVA